MIGKHWKGYVEWVLVVALVLGTGLLAQSSSWAQGDAEEGRIVRIAPERNGNQAPDLSTTEQIPGAIQRGLAEMRPQPRYWVGIVGGPLTPELLAHVEVPQGEGVLVREVMPGSPAAEAGLQTFDILLRANNAPLIEMGQLASLVATEGERQSQITLEIIRRGRPETVWVTPAERPADAQPQGFLGGGQFPGQMGFPQGGDPEELMRRLEGLFSGPGQGFSFRNFGPGVVLGQQPVQMPNGVSVSIERRNDQAPRITVQRDGETWEVVGDDPESLDRLPDELRPFVEQMLRQNAGPFSLDLGPNADGAGLGGMIPRLSRDNPEVQQRLELLDQQLQELRERFSGQEAAPETR